MLNYWKNAALWKKVISGFVFGLGFGLLIGLFKTKIDPNSTLRTITQLIPGLSFDGLTSILSAGGKLFINAIKMLIVPLIFSSLIVGITSMKDLKKMGRIGLKTFGLYLLTTCFAITVGIVVAKVIEPGSFMKSYYASNPGVIEQMMEGTSESKASPSFLDTLTGIIPNNPINAMANGNVLQIIVFALLFGIAINMAGEKGKPVSDFCNSLAEIMYKLTYIVMELAPYGIFCLMAWVSLIFGTAILAPLAMMVFSLYLACAIHMFAFIGGIIFFFAQLNPIPFFVGLIDAHLVAFTTTSSSGTLPVTIKCAEKNLGVSPTISSFVLPLGATINMDGTAIYQGVCAIFIAQVLNIDLTLGNYITIILTSTLASIGTAGVPGAGLIMLSLVLESVGLPIAAIALVAGVDRILDMARTMVNVTGDAMAAVLIAKSEKELDETIYNQKATV
jgi:Na+/H+-dicarboxylate symporter